MKIRELIKLREFLEQKQRPMRPFWDDVDLVFSSVIENADGSIFMNEDMADITAMISKNVQSEGLANHLTNSTSDWFDLEADLSTLDYQNFAGLSQATAEKSFRGWLEVVKNHVK